MRKIEVKTTKFKESDQKEYWYAEIPEMPGLGESGNSEAEAFNELMISLKVKIAFDNNISF